MVILSFSEEDTKECSNKFSRVACGALSSVAHRANLLLHCGRDTANRNAATQQPQLTRMLRSFASLKSFLSFLNWHLKQHRSHDALALD